MTDKPEILVERDGAIGRISINRPQRLNALTLTMRGALEEALEQLEYDPDVRCIVLTGVGRAFCTGGDMKVMRELMEDDARDTFEDLVRTGARIVQRIDEMETVVVAAVNGPAVGAGACLALACDLRIAAESASIGFGFMRVGIHPDWGATYFLPRLVGPSLAAEFLYTGEIISAERAERLGLFNRVVSVSSLDSSVRTLAGQIAAAPQEILADLKRGLRRSLSEPLEQVLEYETEAQMRAFGSPDFREGVTAFLDKRTPRFSKKNNVTREPQP